MSKTGFGDFPFRTRQRQYAWQNDFDVSAPLARWNVTRALATLASSGARSDVATDDAFAVTSRDTNAVFGVYQLARGAHALQANLRRDDATQFGSRTTGAVAYGYRISPAWRVTASYGTAFKAPSFNDLYFPGFSNPEPRARDRRATSREASTGTALHWASRSTRASSAIATGSTS